MARQSRQTVILTRPRPAALRFAAQLTVRFGPDLQILIAPLLAPEFLSPALPAAEGAIFTSETGVAGLARLTAARGPAICVGPGTAAAALAAGWQAEVLGGDAAGMVAALTARPRPGRWLHARGRDAAADLATLLGGIGMALAEAVVYAQHPQPLAPEADAALRGPEPVILPVFSPRSSRVFMAQAPQNPAPLHVAAISAAALAPLRPARSEIATTPDAPGMLDAIGRLLTAASGA